MNATLATLRHHVSDAIARGEGNAIVEIRPTTPDRNTLLDLIARFVRQRPGFEYGNYGSLAGYRADSSEATRNRKAAETLLARISRSSITVDELLAAMPSRLSLSQNAKGAWALHYTAGQYWCVEFRPAVARWLASALWAYYREHCNCTTREKIHASARRDFPSRFVNRWFN